MRLLRWMGVVLAGPLLAQSAAAADFDATLEWARRVTLGTPVSGIVSEVSVGIGDTVEKGAVMLRLDATPFEAEVAELQARVDRTRAELDEQTRALERAQELYDREVLSTVELDQARLAHARAQGAHGEAAAGLRAARYRLQHAEIRAPFAGVVVAREVEAGQTIVAELQAPALLTLAEAGRYRAVMQVPLATAVGLAAGREASVSVGGERYAGRISAIGVEPVAGAGEPRFAVVVEFASGAAVLRPGTPASVSVQ